MTPDQFVTSIDAWVKEGGDFPDVGYYDVSTTEEADAVIRALQLGDLDSPKLTYLAPNIFKIASLLQSWNADIRDYFSVHAAESLRVAVTRHLDADVPENMNREDRDIYDKKVDGYLFALQALIRFGHTEDAELVIKAIRKPRHEDEHYWSSLLAHASSSLPNPEDILEALRDPLPEKFSRIAFLDFANALCFDGRAADHPFDTDKGFEFLQTLIDQDDTGYDSYVLSAIKAAPFLSESRYQYLVDQVKTHPFRHLRPEADWAMARRDGEQGLAFLHDGFQIWQSHSRAARYLTALGEALPALTAQDPARFKAMVDYADWMADEQDFAGYPLENIKILDRFDLIWPAPGQTTPFWRVAYDTLDLFTDEPELGARAEGISLVSTAGFARFFEDFEDADDKRYNLSAAVEYDEAYKPYVESWPDRDWCEQRLETLNPGVFERDDVFGSF